MSAAAVLVLAVLAQSNAGRLSGASASCTGPLTELEVAWPDGSAARVALELGAGEARELELVLPLPAAGAIGEPALHVRGGGSARLGVLPGESARAFAAAWERAPIALRLRPAPPAADGGSDVVRLPARALFAAGACVALVLALRARPRTALGAGALGAALALALARPEASARAEVEVLEGDGAAWVLARAARSRLELARDGPEYVTALPPEVPLLVEGDGASWSVSAPGALLVARRPLPDIAARALGGPRNDLEDLARCWVRGYDGLWSHRGAWARGAALPDAVDGPPPPAGLVAGLPAGLPVLLAERARGERPESARAWLRRVGFDPGPAPAQGTGKDRD